MVLGYQNATLQRFLRDDSRNFRKIIFNIILSFFSNYLQKNILTALKYVLIGSMFGIN